MQRDKILAAIFSALPIVGIGMFIYGARSELPLSILVAWLVISIVFIFFFPFVAARLWLRIHEAAKQSEREILSSVDGLVGGLEPGKEGSAVHEGIQYHYHHELAKKRNGRPSFIVSVPCLSEGSFRITQETGFDRLAKALGVTCEIQTRDHAFDRDFFLHTNTVGFTSEFFHSPQKRQAVREISELGFTSIEHDGEEMAAVWSTFQVKEDLDPAFVTRAVSSLASLAKDLPAYSPRTLFGAPSWKVTRAVVAMIPSVGVVGGCLLYLWSNARYTPLDWGAVMLYFLKHSLAACVVFLVIALLLVRGRSNSHRELAAIIPLSLFGFPIAGVALGLFLNAWLDTSTPSTHVAPLVRKYQRTSGSSSSSRRRTYY